MHRALSLVCFDQRRPKPAWVTFVLRACFVAPKLPCSTAAPLPESLGTLPSLAVLQSACALCLRIKPAELLPASPAGPLPESLGALPSLAVLQAGNNALSGTGSLVAFSQVWGHFLRMLVTCIAMDSTWQPGLLYQRSWALPPARRCLFWASSRAPPAHPACRYICPHFAGRRRHQPAADPDPQPQPAGWWVLLLCCCAGG